MHSLRLAGILAATVVFLPACGGSGSDAGSQKNGADAGKGTGGKSAGTGGKGSTGRKDAGADGMADDAGGMTASGGAGNDGATGEGTGGTRGDAATGEASGAGDAGGTGGRGEAMMTGTGGTAGDASSKELCASFKSDTSPGSWYADCHKDSETCYVLEGQEQKYCFTYEAFRARCDALEVTIEVVEGGLADCHFFSTYNTMYGSSGLNALLNYNKPSLASITSVADKSICTQVIQPAAMQTVNDDAAGAIPSTACDALP